MMNKTKIVSIFFLFLSIILQNINYAQCPEPPGTWNREYPNNTTFKWNLSNYNLAVTTIIKNGVGLIETSEKETEIKNAINWAMNQWSTVLEDNDIHYSEGQSSTYPINIYFEESQDVGAYASHANNDIVLYTSQDWVLEPRTALQEEADLYATILHELGHHMLSLGHTAESNSVMHNGKSTARNFTDCDLERIGKIYDPTKTVTVKNSFGYGKMYVDNSLTYITSSSGKIYTNWLESSFPHTLKGKTGQWDDGFLQVFEKWLIGSNTHNVNIETPIYAENATYTAKFLDQYNVTINGGKVKIDDGNPEDTPTTHYVLEDKTIKVEALYYVANGIEYLFDHWDNSSTINPETFTINNGHKTITSYSNGRPYNSYRNLHFNTSDPVGTSIKVMWNQHPNSNVTKYKIYRKTKYGSPALISTVNRTSASSYTYTDGLYSITNNTGSNNLLNYDVRAYYSTEGTISEDDWRSVYGEILFKETEEDLEERVNLDVLEYSISNYPNPFNPTTTIHYQLPEDANVSIKVFDILGKQIAELVNGEKGIGKHNIMFNSSNLSAGLYFYTIEAKPINSNGKGFSKTNKMLLVK